jgi:hypothetical protein
MSHSRILMVLALAAVASASTSCTIAKPLVCAITAPAYVLGNSGSPWCGCHCDGEAVLCGIVAISAVGAVSGLVTGIISDVNWVRGVADDPAHNIANPFATNTQ